MHRAAHERFRLWPKGQLYPPRSAEEIRHDRITAALNLLEKQCRPALFNHTTMDFGQLKIRVNFRSDFNEVVLAREQFQE
jgi:hypothetical protein